MNFYKHHIGDYAQATSHLNFCEDAAYTRMLRKYYAEEKPLPVDVKAVQRLVGARSRDERDAVVTVLEEFFVLESDGWHNKRADEELAKYSKQAETNRQIAEEREAKKRARKQHDSSDGSLHDSLHDSSASREPSHKPESISQIPEPDSSVRGDSSVPGAGHENPPPLSDRDRILADAARAPALRAVPLDQGKFRLTHDWRPDPEILKAQCLLAGVDTAIVTQAAIAEFVTYWSGEMLSQTSTQWVGKLITQARRSAVRTPAAAVSPQAAEDKRAELKRKNREYLDSLNASDAASGGDTQ